MTRIAAFLMSYLLLASPALAVEDTSVLEHTEAAVAQPAGVPHAAVEAAHESGGLPQFDVSTFPTQVFWLFVMFAIIYIAVKTVIMPQIGGTMEAREKHIEADLQAAGVLTEQARHSMSEYETNIKSARQNAQVTLNNAREQVSKLFADAETTQREQFQSARETATISVTQQKNNVLATLETEAKTLAGSLAQKLLSSSSIKAKKEAA